MILQNVMNLVAAIVIQMPAQMPTPAPTPEPAVSERGGLVVQTYQLPQEEK